MEKQKLSLSGPVPLSEDEKKALMGFLAPRHDSTDAPEPMSAMDGNMFVTMLDKLLSGLHLRQKTNLLRQERNGLAALDAKLVHKFERRGYVDTVLQKYADSFREHSVSIEDVGGKRMVGAMGAMGGSQSSITNINPLPPQIQAK